MLRTWGYIVDAFFVLCATGLVAKNVARDPSVNLFTRVFATFGTIVLLPFWTTILVLSYFAHKGEQNEQSK